MKMTIKDIKKMMETTPFLWRCNALQSAISFSKTQWDEFQLRFLLHLAQEHPAYVNDFEFHSMVIHDHFGAALHRFSVEEIVARTGASRKAAQVQLKRRLMELIPVHFDTAISKELADEELRIFSAYVFLNHSEWFLEEDLLISHQGGTGWMHRIEESFAQFRAHENYRLT